MLPNTRNHTNIKPNAIVYTLALTLLVGMHISLPNRGGTGLDLPFNTITWGIGCITVALSLLYLVTLNSIKIPFPALGLLVVSASLLPSTIWYWQGPISLITTAAIIAAAILITTLFNHNKNQTNAQRELLLIIATSSSIELIGGIAQNFGYSIFSLGFATPPFGSRPGGVFQQPNLLGSFIATGFAATAALAILLPPKHPVGGVLIRATLIYSAVTVATIFILGSRMTWASCGLVIACLILASQNHPEIRRRILLGALLGVVMGVIWSKLIPENEELITSKAKLDSARWITWLQTTRMIVERPLIGYGSGNFESEYVHHAASMHAIDSSSPPPFSAMGHPHNEILALATEFGVLPPILLIIGIVTFLVYLHRTMPRDKFWLSVALLGPLAIHNFLEFPFAQSAPHFFVGCLLLAVISMWGQTGYLTLRAPSQNLKQIISAMSVTLCLVGPLFFSALLLTTYALTKVEQAPLENLKYLGLVSVTGPMEERYQIVRNSIFLELSMTKNDRLAGELFMEWADSYLEKTPTMNVYPAAIFVGSQLKRPDQVTELCREALHFFPQYFYKLQDNGCKVAER